ncbi:MAG: DUF3574 domain-containing protein [Candidatus Manganitrophaceae bacterium]
MRTNQLLEKPQRKWLFLFWFFMIASSLLPACAVTGENTRPISPFRRQEGVLLVSDLLFFGLSTANGPVPNAEWDDFVRDIVTPRFPNGITYWEATGQWRGTDHRLIRERSMVLQILHPDTPQTEFAVQEIILRYKQQFEQDSVLRLRDHVTAWF